MNSFQTKTGFSIELVGWRLELRGEYKGLPLYESLGGIVTAIALVKNPAVGKISVALPDEKLLYGVVMSPDEKMFRNIGMNGRTENCYWYFSAKTIEELRNTFTGTIKVGH